MCFSRLASLLKILLHSGHWCSSFGCTSWMCCRSSSREEKLTRHFWQSCGSVMSDGTNNILVCVYYEVKYIKCGCAHYESSGDGRTARWLVWSLCRIPCRHTACLPCACGRDASAQWTEQMRPSSTDSSTFYLQMKNTVVMLVSTCATVYMIYAWYKTEEPSHPPHASSWCGMRVRQPQKSSCHSVCSGRVFLLCVDACGSSETRWPQTSPHTPRMRRVSPRNVQCVYDIKDLKDISTEHIKQSWQKSKFCVQKCPSSPFTYLFTFCSFFTFHTSKVFRTL